MNERLQILFMQTRLLRLAREEWHLTLKDANRLYCDNGVYRYIADLWGLFHVEGDDAVFDEIKTYLKRRGVTI